jgi:hypothetical protein
MIKVLEYIIQGTYEYVIKNRRVGMAELVDAQG